LIWAGSQRRGKRSGQRHPGRDLLRAIATLAAEAGIERISLSVERKNFARGLYLSEGFTVIAASDPQSDTMVKTSRMASQPAQARRVTVWTVPFLVGHPDPARDDARPSETTWSSPPISW
jgi:hypothetical protein